MLVDSEERLQIFTKNKLEKIVIDQNIGLYNKKYISLLLRISIFKKQKSLIIMILCNAI